MHKINNSSFRPRGSLKNRKYILSEVERIKKEHNLKTLPNQKFFSTIGESSIAVAISIHHGGFSNFRNSLNESDVKLTSGTWKDRNFAVSFAKKLKKKHKLKVLPDSGTLRKMGYVSFASSISKYHGGYVRFRKIIGEDDKTPIGSWKNLEYAIMQGRRAMAEQKTDVLPGSSKLIEMGYGVLVASVHEYHGGMRKFRQILGQKQIVAEHGVWKNLDYALDQGERFLVEHPEYSTIPTHEVLRKFGYSALSTSIIDYHGGTDAFKEKLRQRLNQPSTRERTELLLEDWVGK